MIAVDVRSPVEIQAAGMRLLNEGLGPDIAQMFIDQLSGRGRDYTKDKYNLPDMTDEEFEEHLELAEAEANGGEMWRGQNT